MIQLRCAGGPGEAKRGATLIRAVLVCIALYAVDVACVFRIDARSAFLAANVALPLDLMVLVPLVFWLLYIRPRGKSPIFVLPVIYLGSLASSAMAVEDSFTIVPCLLVAAFAVDAVVLCFEVPRIFRLAKRLAAEAEHKGMSPSECIAHCAEGILGGSKVARALSMELAMWWYLLRSWGKPPYVPEGVRAFSYHKDCNAVAMSSVLVFLGVFEAAAVHVALSRVSLLLAMAATVLTAYMLVWLIANTRAMVLEPILVDGRSVFISWGFMYWMRIERSNVDAVVRGDLEAPKSESADLSSLGGSPCWLILKEPVEFNPVVGKVRKVRYVKLSPDDSAGFIRELSK